MLKAGGELRLIRAGAERTRAIRVRYFNWGELVDRLDGWDAVKHLLDVIGSAYDPILIDLPSGAVTEASALPASKSSLLVACFSLDSESIDTTSANSRWIGEHLNNPDLMILPVAMMVENNEQEWLMHRREYARERFKSLNRHQVTGSDAQNWTPNNIPEIPFIPYFKYERRLPFPSGYPFGLAESFLRLAGSIFPDTELCLPDSGQNFFEKYVHKNASPYGDDDTSGNHRWPRPYQGNEPYAFPSYARDDQDEVMLLIQELAELGFRIWWDDGIVAGSDWQSDLDAKVSQCRHLLLFLSARSATSPHVQREVGIATAMGKTVLAVRLDWTEISPAYKEYLLRYQILDRRSPTFEVDLGRAMFSLFPSAAPPVTSR